MPTYTNAPPPNPRGHTLTLIRVPPGQPLVAIVTTDDLIGTNTHFWGGRTVPCETPNCKPCREGQPYRWHAYLGIYEPNTAKQAILELTANSAHRFVEYRLAHGTLRGCHFRAQRANYSRNSRVIIETKPADLEKINLPPPPDTIRILSIIWNLPATAQRPTGQGGLAPSHETSSDLADASRCLPVGPYAEALANRILNNGDGNEQAGP
jgi:hypothetical protein